MNYFELFDLPIAPTADGKAVYRKYVELQRSAHPDFFTQEDEIAREDALAQSAEINKAYRTFKDPMATIAYYLKVKGALTDDEKYQLPNDFLMEMMDLNEMVEEDAVSARERVSAFEKELDETAKSKEPGGNISAAQLNRLKEYYFKKKYLQRLRSTDN